MGGERVARGTQRVRIGREVEAREGTAHVFTIAPTIAWEAVNVAAQLNDERTKTHPQSDLQLRAGQTESGALACFSRALTIKDLGDR